MNHRLFQFSFFSLALFIPFSIAGANFAIGFATLAWIIAALTGRKQKHARIDPFLIASVVLVVSAIPSVFMSEDFTRALKDWRSYWLLLIYFVVAVNLLAHQMREAAFWTLFASTTVSCLVAFVQRAGGVDFWFIHIGNEHRVGSTLYTMTFAGILYQVIVLNFSVALRRGLGRRRAVVLWMGLAVQFTALLLTMTRGAWLALAAGLVAVCVLVRNRTVLIAAGVLVVAMVAFSVLYSRDQGRTISPGALLNSAADRNVGTRLVLWDMAWDMFRAHPVLGVGMGDYTVEANKLVGERKVTTTVDSHNVYLQTLATRGLLGFLPFVFFWVVIFWMLFRVGRAVGRDSPARHYAVGAIGVTVAVLVGALTENNIDDSEIFIAYMFILGLARSAAYGAHGPDGTE